MNIKKYLSLFMLLCLAEGISAQVSPKWVEKAKRAVFSVVTYDEQNQIRSTGNGFFISEDGVALADYRLFSGAKRAVIINTDGQQMPVETILGANDMYDVLKFRVAITSKKVPALPVATAQPAVGAEIYLLPYSTQKSRACTIGKIQAVDKVNGRYGYYTLQMQLKDKMVSCPVMDAEGHVFGLAQKASGQDTTSICYAMDARFAADQAVSALSFNDRTLLSIGIPKALPETEEQALVYLFMAQSQVTSEGYKALIEQFINQFPQSTEGYMRRAEISLTSNLVKEAKADMDKALEVAQQKDDAHYNRAKLIFAYAKTQEKPAEGCDQQTALDEVRKALTINALPLYRQLEGDILFYQGKYEEALPAYQAVNASELASAESLKQESICRLSLKQPAEEALALMDSCIARFSQPYTELAAPYLLERARQRSNVGKPRLALQDYDEYFKAVNGQVNAVFYWFREQEALKARQYQRALDDIAKAIELEPKNVEYRAELAVVNIRVGRNEEAIKVLDEALAVDSTYGEAYRLKGLALVQLKKKAEARKCFEKAIELGSEEAKGLIEKHCK